jgi:hypothetical protein
VSQSLPKSLLRIFSWHSRILQVDKRLALC